MNTNINSYFPVFRLRQQELIVLKDFDFGGSIFPVLEIIKPSERKGSKIKEQDNSDNKVHTNKSSSRFGDIDEDSFNRIYEAATSYIDKIATIKSTKVFVDIPTEIKVTSSMNQEVASFLNLFKYDYTNKIAFFKVLNDELNSFKNNMSDFPEFIPVIRSYLKSSGGDTNTLSNQFSELKQSYGPIAFRIFIGEGFQADIDDIKNICRNEDFVFIDFDKVPFYPTSPIAKSVIKKISEINQKPTLVLLRSALNSEILNSRLRDKEMILEADNSHLDLDAFQNSPFKGVGDYAGVKKDDISSGGVISPGFIIYDPEENQYFGFNSELKNLNEFQNTIVPNVFKHDIIKRIKNKDCFDNNPGIEILLKIVTGEESGKSQAKFKKISIFHYLHCVKTMFKNQ